MPNLDLSSSRAFWRNYEDPMIYRVVSFMETVENWAFEGESSLEKTIEKIGTALEELKTFKVGKEESWIKLCAHLKTSRILRILQAIDTIEPGSASQMLMYAEEHHDDDNELTSLFLKRNILFERLRLLARTFSQERFALTLKLLEHE